MRVRSRLLLSSAAASAFLLGFAFALPADARKFQMGGTWLVRKGNVFLPLQFAGVATSTTQLFHASKGSWTEAPFSPTGTPMGGMSALAQVVRGAGGVSATGSGPAALRIPKHRFMGDHAPIVPLSGINLIQITTMLQIDAPFATASLMASGGPGSFTWCPGNPACTGGAPLGSKNGRVIYIAGANRFGGTMQMGLRGGGISSVPIRFGTKFFAAHGIFFGSGTMLRKLAVGGGANDAPTLQKTYLARGYVTAPTMVPPMGSPILHPGPFVTTMFGNTLTMPAGGKLRLPPVSPGMTMTAQYTTNEAFPHTTGTVVVQQITYGIDDLFSVMGSDARTPLGAGNIHTVAGGLARRNASGGGGGSILVQRYGTFDKGFPAPG